MRTAETAARLTAFERRGAGTDAERRAAAWLCSELEGGRREAALEPFWCRPNWALAHAWHVGLGVAGSLVSVSSPTIGASLVLVAIVSVLADAVWGASPGRRLTPERVSQNVVSRVGEPESSVRVIVTANYDAGRLGLVYRATPRAAIARLRQATGGRASPGWIGWLVIALAWAVVVALVRLDGARGTWVAIAQLIPTAGLVLALALLLELAGADPGPAAGDNASGVAVALTLARALDAAPPRRLAVEVVLQGAGDGEMIGLRRHLKARRRELGPANLVVLGIAPCGAGELRWWISDGPLFPLRYATRLRMLSARVAGEESHLGAGPYRGRGVTPALPARARQLPAIAIGCLDARGLVPRSHRSGDTPDALDHAAMERTLELGLALVDAIDADLTRAAAAATVAPAP
jgi:hypothetical protein